jgi:hypothetical protein
VVTSLDFLSNTPDSLPKELQDTLASGIIVTYAKPFSACYGVTPLPAKIVPQKYRKFHEVIMDLRNKAFAHIDAKGFQADDPTHGNINEVRVTFAKANYVVHVMMPSFRTIEPLPIKPLCQTLLDKCTYHVDRFANKYLERQAKAVNSGEYKVSVDPNDNVAFVPAKPQYARPALAFG